MQTSYFLAKLIGPFCLALAVGLLANGAHYRAIAEEFLNSRALVLVAGLITLPAGLAIVLTHNVWVVHWPVLITVLGWLLVVGGAVRIVIPQQAMAVGRAVIARPGHITIGAAIWLAIGALLCFFGFIH